MDVQVYKVRSLLSKVGTIISCGLWVIPGLLDGEVHLKKGDRISDNVHSQNNTSGIVCSRLIDMSIPQIASVQAFILKQV